MDDLQLIEQARQGDTRAFTLLVARHQQVLYRLCYRLTGSAQAADELAHDAFVEAFLKLEGLRDPARFVPWVRTIALNLFRMALRQQVPAEELSDDLPAAAPTTDLLPARLSHGLSRLSPSHRLALVLHYLEGLSYEEVATFLDVPIGTVMSRLHRGKAALKRLLETISDEEVPMIPDEFTHEVDAEIATLLALARQEKTAGQRLSVLLAHSPERIAALIADAPDDETLTNVAVLLRRLGRPAIEVALTGALTGEAEARAHASQVLLRFFVNLRQGARGGQALLDMPPFEAYLLLDAFVRANAPAEHKAELLLTLLEASDYDPTTALLITMALGEMAATFPRLLGHLIAAKEPEAVAMNVLAALARTGTRFVAALRPLLASVEPTQRALALRGMDAYARSRYSRQGEPTWPTIRRTAKWAPIPPEHIDAAVEAEAIAAVAALLADEVGEVRDRAVRVLGLLQAVGYRTQIEALATHTSASTRVAALRALADLGEQASVPVFLQATQGEEAAERLAAVEALGRLQVAEAEAALVRGVDDTDRQVRQAAVGALGDIGGEGASALLRRLTTGDDRNLARIAVRALHTSPHYRWRRPDDQMLQYLREQVHAKTIGEAVEPEAFISLYAAIAALPELRPYPERELTRLIARACEDYATTRRQMIMDGLMTRERGIYTLTDVGAAVWRVEHYLREHYLQ